MLSKLVGIPIALYGDDPDVGVDREFGVSFFSDFAADEFGDVDDSSRCIGSDSEDERRNVDEDIDSEGRLGAFGIKSGDGEYIAHLIGNFADKERYVACVSAVENHIQVLRKKDGSRETHGGSAMALPRSCRGYQVSDRSLLVAHSV